MPEGFKLGFEVTLIGMGVVFLALFFLYLIMVSFSFKEYFKGKRIFKMDDDIDPEIVAVISAACVAVLERDFEIKKITLIKEHRHINSLWSFYARFDNIQEINMKRGVL